MIHKNSKGIIYSFMFIKYIAALLFITLSINFIGYPLMAQTIESDAGKKIQRCSL
jgi:hypothetical protein